MSFAPSPGLLVGGRHELELAHGVAHEPELLVQAREPLVHPDVVRVELQDLLVDGDGLEEEALLGVGLGDPLEGLRGGACRRPSSGRAPPTLSRLRTSFGSSARIRWYCRDRLVERPLLNELGRLGDDLVLVDSHRAGAAVLGGGSGPAGAAASGRSAPAPREAGSIERSGWSPAGQAGNPANPRDLSGVPCPRVKPRDRAPQALPGRLGGLERLLGRGRVQDLVHDPGVVLPGGEPRIGEHALVEGMLVLIPSMTYSSSARCSALQRRSRGSAPVTTSLARSES